MHILIVEPGRKPRPAEIDGSLKSMPDIVGGLIQVICPFETDEPVVLVCNDEGKINGLRANRSLRDKDGQIYDIVCGTFFLCGAPPDSDSFTDLTIEQIEKFSKVFQHPEIFLDINGKIVCLPLEEGENQHEI